ncbi:MAG: NUDIX domain-containing protein, partial [Ruminococcus sp.]|nr:NUDIX domain-containing protein [Ruminococcus sp.]
GIIFIDGKLLLIENDHGEAKLPGGGQEEGEDDCATLLREVREETGYRVLPDSVRAFGYIEEKRRSLKEDMIWHQFSRLYFCEVESQPGETELSENEKSLGFRLSPYSVEDAISLNERMLEREGRQPWNQREYLTLCLIRDHLHKDN